MTPAVLRTTWMTDILFAFQTQNPSVADFVHYIMQTIDRETKHKQQLLLG